MHEGYRYRVEDGRFCIDIRLRSARQLFDGRDPAPFRERDLEDRAVEYLVGAVEELPRDAPVKLVFWISDEPAASLPDATIVEAVRAHFEYEVVRLDRRIRHHMRQGQRFLLFGLAVLVIFLTLAQLTSGMNPSHLRQIVREGLVITGWVALWRPIEVLLYDWWPIVEERRTHRRLREAPIEVRHEADALAPPAPASAS